MIQIDFPFLEEEQSASENVVATKKEDGVVLPHLIVFIMGGACYSETRVGYEVSQEKKYKNWKVIVGGSHILTPKAFLQEVKNL